MQTQIPFGNDRKKNKGKGKNKQPRIPPLRYG
jgi:hypothetical protein